MPLHSEKNKKALRECLFVSLDSNLRAADLTLCPYIRFMTVGHMQVRRHIHTTHILQIGMVKPEQSIKPGWPYPTPVQLSRPSALSPLPIPSYRSELAGQ